MCSSSTQDWLPILLCSFGGFACCRRGVLTCITLPRHNTACGLRVRDRQRLKSCLELPQSGLDSASAREARRGGVRRGEDQAGRQLVDSSEMVMQRCAHVRRSPHSLIHSAVHLGRSRKRPRPPVTHIPRRRRQRRRIPRLSYPMRLLLRLRTCSEWREASQDESARTGPDQPRSGGVHSAKRPSLPTLGHKNSPFPA